MITICPMHNGGHLSVCTIKISSRHMGEIVGLNNKTAQLSKLQQYRDKVSQLECRCFCSHLTLTLSFMHRDFMHPQSIIP